MSISIKNATKSPKSLCNFHSTSLLFLIEEPLYELSLLCLRCWSVESMLTRLSSLFLHLNSSCRDQEWMASVWLSPADNSPCSSLGISAQWITPSLKHIPHWVSEISDWHHLSRLEKFSRRPWKSNLPSCELPTERPHGENSEVFWGAGVIPSHS